MQRLSMLVILLSFARPSLAEPAPPEAVQGAKAAAVLVEHALLEPMALKERQQSRFSRARLPAAERRVRILDEEPRHDARGDAFFIFAIDARHGLLPVGNEDGWQTATITGCVYLGRSEVLVQNGDRHRPAAFLLGKRVDPVDPQLCHG